MKRPQYFAAKPLQDTEVTVYSEIELWRAVLDQALQDISYMDNVMNANIEYSGDSWIYLTWPHVTYLRDDPSTSYESSKAMGFDT